MALRIVGDLLAEGYGDQIPQVLALHGWGRRGSDFSAVLDGLNAVAPDLPGFGATPEPANGMGTHGYSQVVADSLEKIDPGPLVVVGHSFGGRVAVRLAAKSPELVAGLVLTGVPLIRLKSPAQPTISYRMMRIAHRVGVVSAERMERLRRSRGSADYRAASGVMRDVMVATVNEVYEEDLGKIRCPVRLVWGSEDQEASPDVAEHVRRILSERNIDVTLDLLDGVGHMVPIEAPKALRTAVESLL